jgi:mono/diheme cytochrome c family protein
MTMRVSHDARFFTLALVLAGIGLVSVRESRAQPPGEQEFQAFCVACHTIGGGRLVGPDLAGIHDRRSAQWLERFVASSQSVIGSGDPDAVAVFEEYSKLPMPDAPFSAEQIANVLSYIETRSAELASASTAAAVPPPPPAGGETALLEQAPPATAQVAPPASEQAVAEPSESDIHQGQDLFQGTIRLANGGPACNACHEVVNDAVIGGGILARELTTVFSRMGMPGVAAILGTPPFPVMQAAYEGKPLTADEVRSLVGFLQYADAQHFYHRPRAYGTGLLLSGTVGGAAFLGFFSLLWRGRKRRSVYQSIYDRQLAAIHRVDA